MSSERLQFVTLDVFTSERFKGNQVAVVKVTKSPLSHEHMQWIAREFNFSETVFLREGERGGPPQINIFTPVNEMDFAGHPVIGTGHTLFRHLIQGLRHPLGQNPEKLTILTKAGPVVLGYEQESKIVSAEVPHNVHIHSKETPKEGILCTQPSLVASARADAMERSYPAVSIVKGVTYTLVDFSEQSDLFAAVTAGESQITELDEGWGPSFTGVVYYRGLDTRSEQGRWIFNLRIRMIAINLEDPACGSGSCTLAVFLALRHGKKNGHYRFNIDQGSEIGRDSHIIVDVVLNEDGDGVSTVELSGQATPVTEGLLSLPE